MIQGLASATKIVALCASPQLADFHPSPQVVLDFVSYRAAYEQKVQPTGTAWVDARLSKLASLQADWDGYGADPVDRDQLNILGALLKAHLPAGAPRGAIVPGADGSVQAEWHLAGSSFGLLVEEGRRVSSWVRPRNGGVETEVIGLEAPSLLQWAILDAMA